MPLLHRFSYRLMACRSRFVLQLVVALLAAWLLVLWPPAQAAQPASPLRVPVDTPAIDVPQLQATRVDVRIAGVIAEVTVVQQYHHGGRRPTQASLAFAGTDQAALHALSMQVGTRAQVFGIRPTTPAGLGAAAAPRADVPVPTATIQPGDAVQVTLRYTDMLVPTAGHYQFVFPAPRQPGGAVANTGLDLQVHLSAPLPVGGIASPSHRIEVSGEHSTQADVMLADDDVPGARDFILEYQLGGTQTAVGWMLAPGADENFFLAMVAAPQTVASAQINPREIVCVVDVSDSMQAEGLATARTVLSELVGALRPSDSFNLMLFAGSRRRLGETSVPPTRANLDRALQLLARADRRGGSELGPLLRDIAAMPKRPELARSVVVITDGHLALDSDVFRRVRQNLGHTGVFVVGIGAAVNRPVVDGLAHAGLGEAFIVTRPELAAAQAERLRRTIEAPVLTQLRARFVGLEGVDIEPVAWPDLLGGRPVWVVGKWRAAPGAASPPHALLRLEGQAADGAYQDMVPAPAFVSDDAGALRSLWARQRIQRLADQEALDGGHAQREALTALGLKYSVTTPYTRFASQHADAIPGLALRAADLPGVATDSAATPRRGVPLPALGLAVGLPAAAGLLLWALRRRFHPAWRTA